jgi:hypothetical protein
VTARKRRRISICGGRLQARQPATAAHQDETALDDRSLGQQDQAAFHFCCLDHDQLATRVPHASGRIEACVALVNRGETTAA